MDEDYQKIIIIGIIGLLLVLAIVYAKEIVEIFIIIGNFLLKDIFGWKEFTGTIFDWLILIGIIGLIVFYCIMSIVGED